MDYKMVRIMVGRILAIGFQVSIIVHTQVYQRNKDTMRAVIRLKPFARNYHQFFKKNPFSSFFHRDFDSEAKMKNFWNRDRLLKNGKVPFNSYT